MEAENAWATQLPVTQLNPCVNRQVNQAARVNQDPNLAGVNPPSPPVRTPHSYLHVQFPLHVVCIHLFVSQRESEWAVLLRTQVRPVSLTLLLQVLLEVGYHGNGLHPLLPDQPPEVRDGDREGTCITGWGHELSALV